MTPYLSEIRLFGFPFAPRGWAFCNGQLLGINQNSALFSLIGVTYGGDGQTTFALPNLQARSPLASGANYRSGGIGGTATHTLTPREMPQHSHNVRVAASATLAAPAGAILGSPAKAAFAAAGSDTSVGMAQQALAPAGGNQPHENMPPFLTLNYCIALSGIFPDRG